MSKFKVSKEIAAIRAAEQAQSSFLAASTDASDLQIVKELCIKLSTTYAKTKTEFLIAMIASDFTAFQTMRSRNDIYSSLNEFTSFRCDRSNEQNALTDAYIRKIDAQLIIHRHIAKRLELRVERCNDSIIDVNADDNSSATKKLLRTVRASIAALEIIFEYHEQIASVHAR